MRWWMISLALFVLGIGFIVYSWAKSRKAPKWFGNDVIAFPNMVGTVPFALGLVFLVLAVTLAVGYYLR